MKTETNNAKGETMIAKVQLYQEGGCSGPKGTIENYSGPGDVQAWADGQIGWPWDGVLVNVYESEEDYAPGGAPTETYEIEFAEAK